MKRLLMLIVAMILLSGAAWGEDKASCIHRFSKAHPNERILFSYAYSWCKENPVPDPMAIEKEKEKDCLSRYIDANPKWELGKKVTNWCKENPPTKKLKADDPTAWKYPTVIVPDVKNEKPPWGDSRYRLERNEVTGKYRITVMSEGGCWGVVWNGWIITDPKYQTGHEASEAEAISQLEHFRKYDKEQKAWRPIK